MFLVNGKMSNVAPSETFLFSLLIRTLPTLWAKRIFVLRICYFLFLLDSRFPAGAGVYDSGRFLDVFLRHSRTLKFRRSKELGQDHENPITVNTGNQVVTYRGCVS